MTKTNTITQSYTIPGRDYAISILALENIVYTFYGHEKLELWHNILKRGTIKKRHLVIRV